MDMDMDMGSSNSTATMSQMMYFHTSLTDNIFSLAWTPQSPAAYFGTWMFIFFFGILYRGLHALKSILEAFWFHKFASKAVVVSSDDDGKVRVVSGGQNAHVWRTSVDIPRAFLQMVNSGVAYLLMIIVMTMNVGYFFAVLSGIFFGELIFGRWASGHHVSSATGTNSEMTALPGQVGKEGWKVGSEQ